MKTKVLLTGNCGYIGRVMAETLRAHGCYVVGLDSLYYGHCELPSPGEVDRQIVMDVRDIQLSDLKGLDAVIHLAGLASDALGEISRELTIQINTEASVRLASLAKQAGIARYIFSSSCSVYGVSDIHVAIDETGVLSPLTEYAKSKINVEKEVSKLADGNFHPTYMRNATAFGFSPSLRLDLVVNNLVAHGLLTGTISILSDGTPWRPLVHVRDISQAFLIVLHAPFEKIHNECFNIGCNAANYQIKDLAQMVKDALPGCTVEILATAASDERTYRVNCNRFARVFPEFRPAWSVPRGIDELVACYRDRRLPEDALVSDRFFRNRWIKKLMGSGHLDTQMRWNPESVVALG